MTARGGAPRGGLARFRDGQRVYVRRDANGGAIEMWGTVARLRRADDGAWIDLDYRHERCPFPPGDRTRSTHVLAWPRDCSTVAPAPSPAPASKGAK